MPITIEVYRGAGDRPGDEVRDDLLGDSLQSALARGRAELDAHAHLCITTALEMVAPETSVQLGDLVAVSDPDQGAEWRGKVIGIKHQMEAGAAPTILTVRRPIDV